MMLALFTEGGLRAAFFVPEIHGGAIPDGVVEITNEQWQDWLSNPGRRRWDGAGVVPYERPPPAPTVQDVIQERDRRLALGFEYDFGPGVGAHQIATTPADMAGWDEVTKIAQALIMTGSPAAGIDIITETGRATVSAEGWMQVLLAAGEYRQPIWAASFALQAMDPIPADYASDAYWP